MPKSRWWESSPARSLLVYDFPEWQGKCLYHVCFACIWCFMHPCTCFKRSDNVYWVKLQPLQLSFLLFLWKTGWVHQKIHLCLVEYFGGWCKLLQLLWDRGIADEGFSFISYRGFCLIPVEDQDSIWHAFSTLMLLFNFPFLGINVYANSTLKVGLSALLYFIWKWICFHKIIIKLKDLTLELSSQFHNCQLHC